MAQSIAEAATKCRVSGVTRLGILGAGAVARHHAAAAHALGLQVSAAVTRSVESPRWQTFKDIAPEARHLSEGTDLLADPDVDAVVACLPWNVMPAWLDRLLAYDKPVLFEKPIALDSRTLKDAVDKCSATGSRRQVGFNRRYYETVCRLAKRISQGGLKAAQITISEDIDSHVAKHGAEVIPHLLAFASCHSLDLALHLFGPLRPVAIRVYPEHGVPRPFLSYNGLLETAAGIPISLALNASDPSPAGIRCLFDDHTTWVLSPIEVLAVFEGYDIVPETAERAIRSYRPRLVEEIVVDSRLKPGFVDQMRAFCTGEIGPGATIEQATKLMDLIDAIEARV